MKRVLIIPDIHGRIFWMEDVATLMADIDSHAIDVVFLGDYIDPYPQEDITDEQAINGFREIIGFARDRDNVHLLGIVQSLRTKSRPYSGQTIRSSK